MVFLNKNRAMDKVKKHEFVLMYLCDKFLDVSLILKFSITLHSIMINISPLKGSSWF
jgi:hypothetical protein